MNKKLKTFLLSLLAPGLGYLQSNDKKSFYRVMLLFYSVIILGASCRIFTTFTGLLSIIVALVTMYVFSAIHATFKAKQTSTKNQTSGILKLCFTLASF